MAKTQTIDVPDELKYLEGAALERRDRFILGVVQGHKRLPSRAQKRLLSRTAVVNSPMEGRGSLFRFLAPLWRQLTTEQKDVWRQAGVYTSITNWQLFISDNAARIRNSLTLEVPPSELWQVRTGRLLIASPANEIILKQEHPQNYFVTKKITGAAWKSELVNIVEEFSLPLELQFRYKSNLILQPGFAVPVTGETISGIVSLSGTPVTGATVRCIRQSDNTILSADTTDASGFYEFSGLVDNEEYHVLVEYETGGQKYRALSFPFRSWFETDFELESYTVPDGDNANFALASYGEDLAYARYFARIWTSYQGQDIETDLQIPLDVQSDWTLDTASIGDLRGIIVGYTLYLQITGYRGEVLFDNIRAIHGGTNWARDPRCDDVTKIFKKGFAVVPPFWIPVSLPSGSSFSTVFPPVL